MIEKNKKVAAIICECNPFHEGHKKIIDVAKNIHGADIVILIMSGPFVQRGEPSCINIEKRVKMALLNGANMVIELPVAYALSSAKYFSTAAISIIKSLGFVDNLIFGSDICDINKLNEYAKKEVDTKAKKNKKTGKIYEEAYGAKLSPNDILAVEYIRSIKKLKCKINAICIKKDYNLPTATTIRELMPDKELVFDNFTNIFKKILIDKKFDKIKFTDYYNISEDFENQIYNIDPKKIYNMSLNDICHMLATKEKTLADVKRKILHIILGIKEKDVRKEKYGQNVSYINILGVDSEGKKILKYVKVPFITDFTPLAYKALNKNFKNSNVIDRKTLKPINNSLKNDIYAHYLYDYLSNRNA